MSRQDYLYFVTNRSEEELLVSFLQPFAPLPPVEIHWNGTWRYFYCAVTGFEAGATKAGDWIKEPFEEEYGFNPDIQLEIDHQKGLSWDINETETIRCIALQLQQTSEEILYSARDHTVLLRQAGKLYLCEGNFWTEDRLALIDFPYEMRSSLEDGVL